MEFASRFFKFKSLLVLFILLTNSSFAQQDSYWKKETFSIPKNISKGTTYSLDVAPFKTMLFASKSEGEIYLNDSDTEMIFPISEGEFRTFKIIKYQIMEDDLAHKYSDFGTFYGISEDHKKIRISWTALGLHAIIKSKNDIIIIESLSATNKTDYVVYNEKDEASYNEGMLCDTVETASQEAIQSRNSEVLGDCQLRTYRLAITTTWKFTNDRGAFSIADEAVILAEIVNTVNFINMVFENDLGIRLLLINNTTDLFYYDQDSDPFTNTGGTIINQNHDNTNAVIGVSNYDIGHLFERGPWDGVAGLKSVCRAGKKGKGRSNRKSNGAMQKHARTVMHEMGHQFAAKHSQNNDCNRSNDSSYEPGSGSTLMSYAGVCAPNVISKSELYYHIKSLKQIHTYIQGYADNCANYIASSNTPPTINAGEDYTIPVATPFKLTPASFADADGDLLTFTWEQYDNEVAPMPPVSTNTEGPTFRSFYPTENPSRYFPKMNKIVANELTSNWQCLPSVARTMNFRVTVRDNSSNMAGCVADDNMKVTITDQAGPFLVSYPTEQGVIWDANSSQTVTWDVAQTDVAPVNCQTVNILLSIDGGSTYPTVLAENMPNNGSATITVPNIETTETARIMVIANDNIFLDISNEDFKIEADPLNISSVNLLDIKIFPNPAKDNITVKINENISKTEAVIYNALGQKIAHLPINDTNTEIALTNFTSGVYFIKISNSNGEFFEKFIKG